MISQEIEALFARIGAKASLRDYAYRTPVSIRLLRGYGSEEFAIDYLPDRVALHVIEYRRDTPHLLLGVRHKDISRVDKYLCGLDERHWFAAAVPGAGVCSVDSARDALMPAAVRAELARRGVPERQRFTRRNAAFIRQGEWFFVPTDKRLEPTARWEALTHGALHRAHVLEEAHRVGGVQVWVCPQHPAGLSRRDYRKLLAENPECSSWDWREMRRDPEVFARGTVTHPDHSTVQLGEVWHRVYMNRENEAAGGRELVFLD
jgi:hypothetical protein